MKCGGREGYGTMTYSDGSIYMGQWKKDMKEGYGIYKCPNGAVYYG
jgi:radial spoke head protein 1